MVAVTYNSASGESHTIDVDPGVSAMEAAVRGGLDGIDADCGGALSCATCHVHVDPRWLDRLDPPQADEREMLEFAIDPDETSRLSCQIFVTPDLDGLILNIPATQR